MQKATLLLFCIIILGFLFRIVAVSSNPAILNRDEAALAYNAYLLAETGRDEWGRSWPIALESFGDYKLPGYPAILVGFFKIFGANDFVVRLPSVLAGTALIPLAYWFLKIFKRSKTVSFFGAFIVAVSPIFMFYSRMAFEANVALSLLVLALCLLFWENSKKRSFLDIASAIILFVAALVYNTPLLLLPFIILAVIIFRGLKNYKTWLIPASLLSLVFLIVLSQMMLLTTQKSGITIFSDPTVWVQYAEYRQTLPGWTLPLIGSKYVYFLGLAARNTLASFAPHFLLFQGGSHPWHSLPWRGHMYILTYITSVVGMLMMAVGGIMRRDRKYGTLLFLTLAGLAPAVITVDAPHTTRSLLFLFMLCIFSAIGIGEVIKRIPINSLRVYTTAAVAGLILISSGLYANDYFNEYPKHQAPIYQTGFQNVLKDSEKLDQIYVVDPTGYQYITTAWYAKMDPQEYFKSVERGDPDVIGFKYGKQVGKYTFVTNIEDAESSPVVWWDDSNEVWKLEVK